GTTPRRCRAGSACLALGRGQKLRRSIRASRLAGGRRSADKGWRNFATGLRGVGSRICSLHVKRNYWHRLFCVILFCVIALASGSIANRWRKWLLDSVAGAGIARIDRFASGETFVLAVI